MGSAARPRVPSVAELPSTGLERRDGHAGEILSQPHRRYNPLLDEWVLVSPERALRPWLGRTDPTSAERLPMYDPSCYLCPGNTRANGESNPPYTRTFVFTNDFAALRPDTPVGTIEQGLLRAEGSRARAACSASLRGTTSRSR